MNGNKRLWVALGIIIFVLILDQSLKIWVKTNMLLGEDSYLHWGWPISWFRLHFIENPGMAFGLTFPGNFGKLFLSLFRIVLVIVLTFVLIKYSKQYKLGFTIFFSLIIAGALGNLIDSMFYGLIFTASPYYSYGAEPAHFVPFGHGYTGFLQGNVVDMLYFPLCYCHFPDWLPFIGGKDFLFFRPVFNIADSSIFIGTVGFLFFKNKIMGNEQNTDNS
jgi:signal peptidase II